ncbi:MAG: hypothetical protein AB7K35_05890 [Pseudorhodoplanes sp.]
MTAITYGATGATISTAAAAPAAPAVRKGFWARAYEAFVEAQMRRAMREIKLHQHLLPADLEIVGNKITYRNEDQLPFVR